MREGAGSRGLGGRESRERLNTQQKDASDELPELVLLIRPEGLTVQRLHDFGEAGDVVMARAGSAYRQVPARGGAQALVEA